MVYVFSFVAGRHRWVMWLFLALRWIVLAALGSPVIAVVIAVSLFAGAHWVAVPIAVIGHIMLLSRSAVYSRHRRVMLLKRRWPVLWAQVQRKQLLDMDDGHLNRPWMAAPKLGFMYRVNGEAVTLSVRPAVGQTLVDLQEQASVIAAQTDLVDSFEVDMVKASSHRGRLKVMFKDGIKETILASERETANV